MTEVTAYRVLARKYRPQSFAELIGQDTLVRTLTNAIRTGRLAHAYVLTGVRGVGKTTTARIIAKALNYAGPDGSGDPSIGPFDDCPVCQAIAADRHPDVIEMDAASHTGVDDVREIIDSVRYGPTSARYKVYIIDEVHMLSKNAFNALLKTLEEPPPHTKFVFATTEIRKVPITVLSRCQRFDLARVDQADLLAHFTRIAEAEGFAIEPEALALVARAADGSVRDGLSLLDQAMALSEDGASIPASLVHGMLGLADRTMILDLLDAALGGKGPAALDVLDRLRAGGADPVVVIQDLLEQVHFLSRLRVVPTLAENPTVPEAERTRGAALAAALSVPVLSRAWQALLKGLSEVQAAPAPHMALEMVVIRLVHMAGLPTPDEALRLLGPPKRTDQAPASSPAPRQRIDRRTAGHGHRAGAQPAAAVRRRRSGHGMRPSRNTPRRPTRPKRHPALRPAPADFTGLARLAYERDPLLHGQIKNMIHLVRYAPGLLEFRPTPGAPRDLASRLMRRLSDWTGQALDGHGVRRTGPGHPAGAGTGRRHGAPGRQSPDGGISRHHPKRRDRRGRRPGDSRIAVVDGQGCGHGQGCRRRTGRRAGRTRG